MSTESKITPSQLKLLRHTKAGWRRLDIQQRAFEKSAASIAKKKQTLTGRSKDL